SSTALAALSAASAACCAATSALAADSSARAAASCACAAAASACSACRSLLDTQHPETAISRTTIGSRAMIFILPGILARGARSGRCRYHSGFVERSERFHRSHVGLGLSVRPQRLDTHVSGSGLQLRFDAIADLVLCAPCHDGVDQPVT